MAQTPGLLPVLTEATAVRTNVKTVVGVGAAVAAAAVWLTVVWMDVQTLKSDMRQVKEDLHRLTWGLPTQPVARGSNNEIGNP